MNKKYEKLLDVIGIWHFSKNALTLELTPPKRKAIKMKRKALTLLSMGLIFAGASAAQDAEPVDEVISQGSIQTDPAMSAWNSGDFATAEVEFKRNAFCALRVERNFRSGVEGARDSTVRADVGVDFDQAAAGAGGQGGAPIGRTAPPPTPSANIESSNFRNKDSETKRTCEDRGFQLYMMGMSQLKLGKTAEAKESLIRAAAMRKNLYDAHFRLSLMEYQDGNIEKAHKQFKKLRKLESKCKGCDAKDEIKAQIKYLKGLLG